MIKLGTRIVYVLIIATSTLQAGLVAWRSLTDVQQRADLIAVGAVTGGGQSGTNVNFTLEVDRVLKGNAALAGTVIQAVWQSGPRTGGASGANQARPGGNGLWFLQQVNGGWELLPVTQGDVNFGQTFIPVPSGAILSAYSYPASAPIPDKVASEISAALESANGGYPSLGGLHFGLLDGLNSGVLETLYRRMAASNSTNQKILGLAGLIRQGNVPAIAAVAQQMDSFTGFREASVLLWSIRNELRATDSAAIATLGQIATTPASSPLELREAAAHALSSIHNRDTLPYLARLFDDPVEDLRIEAVGGMAAFANGLPIQTTSNVPSGGALQLADNTPYRTAETIAHFAQGKHAIKQNEAGYISFWRNWWAQNSTELTGRRTPAP